MATKFDRSIARDSLRALQARVGGRIVGNKLLPIAPTLTALCPLEPACDLQRRWHVVQVEPQQEGKVEGLLKDAKLDAYSPKEPRRIRVSALRHRTAWRPMLMGYLFAGFDVTFDCWQAIPEMRGVVRLLMVEERPVPIADDIMIHIRTKEAERSNGRCANIPVEIKIGVVVRIIEPLCWSGLFGKVVDIDPRKREIGVEIDIFGRMVPLNLSPEQIETV